MHTPAEMDIHGETRRQKAIPDFDFYHYQSNGTENVSRLDEKNIVLMIMMIILQ